MLNIKSAVAKTQYHASLIRQMKALEYTCYVRVKPVLGQCYLSSARMLELGISNVKPIVDNQMPRIRQILMDHYKRVGNIFSDIVFKSLEDGVKNIYPAEIKSLKDEWWRAFSNWVLVQAAAKVTYVSNTTKRLIATVIDKGVHAGKSYKNIAKDLRKVKNITNPYRASMIARTETHSGMSKSMNQAMRSSRVEHEREWSSTKDERTRINHLVADGERIGKDDKYVKTGEPLDFPGDPKGSAGNIIHCIASGRTQIFTSTGWKKIREIKEGDLVLTHKNRFRKVLKTKNRQYKGDLIKIIPKNKKCKFLLVTPEHQFLMDNGIWKNAEDIKVGDSIKTLASFCHRCGKPIPYWNKYCSRSCCSKDITDKQWSNLVHRENMSKKTSEQLKREYVTGIRNKKEITKKAREYHIKKYGKSGYIGTVINDSPFRKKIKDGVIKKYGSYLNMLKQKAFPALGKVNYNKSRIEQAMEKFLIKNNKEFVCQYSVGRRHIDFYIKNEKLFIEVDGFPFHQDKEKERKRDLEILNQYSDHTIAHVTYKENPPKWEYYNLQTLNHTGTYKQVDVEIEEVKRVKYDKPRRVYNFSVEEDESYMAKGFVSHNCRCVELFHVVNRFYGKEKPLM